MSEYAAAIMVFAAGALALGDLALLAFLGIDATISKAIQVWAFEAHPLFVWCFGFFVGGLIVHFLAWKPGK